MIVLLVLKPYCVPSCHGALLALGVFGLFCGYMLERDSLLLNPIRFLTLYGTLNALPSLLLPLCPVKVIIVRQRVRPRLILFLYVLD